MGQVEVDFHFLFFYFVHSALDADSFVLAAGHYALLLLLQVGRYGG